MHQLQPTQQSGSSKSKGSQEPTINEKQQLPSADSLLADPDTLQVLRKYFPTFRKPGKVFETDNSKRLNIYLHKGLYLVKDFTGMEFGDDASRNVLQVLQF